MAARAAAGRQFLVELRPSFAPWPPHLTCTPGPSTASWGHPGSSWSWWWWRGWWRRGGGAHSGGLASGGFHPIPTDLTSNAIWARCTSCVGASWTIQTWIREKVKVIIAYLQLQLQEKVKVVFSFWENTWLLIFRKQLWYSSKSAVSYKHCIVVYWLPGMGAILDDDMGGQKRFVIVKMMKKRPKWDWREKWWVNEYFNSSGLAAIFYSKSHLPTHSIKRWWTWI